MIAKAAKWAGIAVDSSVEIDESDDRIIIKAVGKKEYSLKELVNRITPQNRHSEADFGPPVGAV